MVDVVGRNIAGNYLGGDALAAQHRRAQAGVVEADAGLAGKGGIGVGHVAAGLFQLLRLGFIVRDAAYHIGADGLYRFALVLRVGNQFACLGNAGAVGVVVAEQVGPQEGREFAFQLHVCGGAVQFHVAVARSVLHHAELVAAVAEGKRGNDGGSALRQVVVCAVSAAGNLQLQPGRAGGACGHIAFGHRRGVYEHAARSAGCLLVEGGFFHGCCRGESRPGCLFGAAASAKRKRSSKGRHAGKEHCGFPHKGECCPKRQLGK